MNSSKKVPPTSAALTEALELSGEILRNLELSDLPLASTAMKTARLARLLNEIEFQRIMEFEVGGYPTTPSGIPQEIFRLCGIAGRQYQHKELRASKTQTRAYTEGISALEEAISVGKAALATASDRDVSISSSNPSQMVFAPLGNAGERLNLRTAVQTAAERLANRKAFIYRYVLNRHYEP